MKKIISIVLCICLFAAFTACSGAPGGDVAPGLVEYFYHLPGAVDLAKYAGLKLEYYSDAITDAAIDAYADAYIKGKYFYSEAEKAAANGDVVNISYTVTVDGAEVASEALAPTDVVVGKNTLLAQIDAALVGLRKGAVKSVDVTLPEDDSNKEIAGKNATYTVTVNAVKVQSTGVASDEFLSTHTTVFKTMEDVKAAAKNYLQTQRTYYNYDIAPYITLGEYKGLKVDYYDGIATDKEIEDYMLRYVQEEGVFYEEVDREAMNGDLVNIDYVGKINGEAFDKGSATNQEFTLGEGSFIPGFQEGIVGMSAGEVKDVEVTFPDPYPNNPDLAGVPAVFTMTLNSVKVQVHGQLTDEFLSTHSKDYPSVEALRAAVKEFLDYQKGNSKDGANRQNILEAIIDKATISSLPKEDEINNTNSVKSYYSNTYTQYMMYGMFSGTFEEFLSQYTGADVTSADDFFAENARDTTRYELVMAAVAKAENMTVTDEEAMELVNSELAESGYSTAEELIDSVGGMGYVKWVALRSKVIKFLIENTDFLDANGNKVQYPEPTAAPTDVPANSESGGVG